MGHCPDQGSWRLALRPASPPMAAEDRQLGNPEASGQRTCGHQLGERILCPTEHDPAVASAVGNDASSRVQPGLGKDSYGKLESAVLADLQFSWFAQHGGSLPQHSERGWGTDLRPRIRSKPHRPYLGVDELAASRVGHWWLVSTRWILGVLRCEPPQHVGKPEPGHIPGACAALPCPCGGPPLPGGCQAAPEDASYSGSRLPSGPRRSLCRRLLLARMPGALRAAENESRLLAREDREEREARQGYGCAPRGSGVARPPVLGARCG